ncbi:MAG: hypothetical protein WAT55_16180 [Candidatus Microthrix parvicella]
MGQSQQCANGPAPYPTYRTQTAKCESPRHVETFLDTLDEATITVVDQDDRHVYQPGILFVPFALAHPDEIVRSRSRQLHRGIDFVESAVELVDIETNTVQLAKAAL